jgi:hypothetical protein
MSKLGAIIAIFTVIFTTIQCSSVALDSQSTTQLPTESQTVNEVYKATKITTVSQSHPEEKDNLIAGLEPGEFYGGITLLVLVLFCVILCSCLCKEKGEQAVQDTMTVGKQSGDVSHRGYSQTTEETDIVIEMSTVIVNDNNETRSGTTSQPEEWFERTTSIVNDNNETVSETTLHTEECYENNNIEDTTDPNV